MHLHFNGPLSAFKRFNLVASVPIPEPEISYGSDFETSVRLNSVKFGDGYEQRSLDGINAVPLSINFAFTKRSKDVVRQVDLFLRGDDVFYPRSPEEYFYYTPPPPIGDEALPTPRKFICRKWKISAAEFNDYSLTGTMDEVFDP